MPCVAGSLSNAARGGTHVLTITCTLQEAANGAAPTRVGLGPCAAAYTTASEALHGLLALFAMLRLWRGRSTDSCLRNGALRVFLLLALAGGASAGLADTPRTAPPPLVSFGSSPALYSAPREAQQLLLRSGATRPLAVVHVAPGDNLQTAIDAASAGDEVVLADGTYSGSGTSHEGANMLYINKTVTIRALNPGAAVLDGERARRVICIASGTVRLDGLKITRGKAVYDVCAHVFIFS